MTARNEDFLFAQEALAQGFVTEAQVQEGLELQRRMAEDLRLDERLAVILVKRGWLAEEQARRVTARLEPRGRRDQIPGYRLVEVVGRGAMGTVYRAVHLGLQRVVAVKVLRRDLAEDPTQVERLRAEAKLLASLDHPNVVRALDAGESNGFPYFVMEFVEGETLKDRIARDGPLPEDDALRIARALADALERARRMGVVHRDVKPGNVLIARDGSPRLMDLGLAKGPVDLGLTEHGATVGTPQYISPEQAQDPKRADTRSDIYSLGATLYAMLAGRPPFEGSTLAEILTKVLYEPPTPVRAVNRSVSQETGYLVERMMLKDPSLRYRTPAEVVRDLDRILGGQSIVPTGFVGSWEGYLLRRRTRRALVAGGLTLAAAVLVGVVVAAVVRSDREERDRLRAEDAVVVALRRTTPRDDDDEAIASDRLTYLREEAARLLPFGPRGGEMLEERERELERIVRDLRAWRETERIAERLRADGRFDAASALLAKFLEEVARGGGPAARAARNLDGEVRAESNAGFEDAVRTARHAPAATLAEFLGLLRAHRDAVGRGFVVTPAVSAERRRAGQCVEILEEAERALADLRTSHAPEVVERRLEDAAAAGLLADLEARSAGIRERAERLWRPIEEEWIPAVAVRELVRAETSAIEQGVRRVAEAWQGRVLERERREAARHEVGAAEGAAARLDAVATTLRAAGLRDLMGLTLQEKDSLERQHRERRRSADEAYRTLVAEVRRGLRERDAEAIRSRLAAARDDPEAHWPHMKEIGELEAIATGLDLLDRAALAGFEARRRVEAVRLRDGTEERRWEVLEVHPEERAVTVSAPRGGRPGPPRRVALREIEVTSLEAVAAAAGPVPPLARAVALLSLVPELESPDLRAVLALQRSVLAALAEAGERGAVARLVDEETQRLAREQDEREEEALGDFVWADDYARRMRWPDAHSKLDDLRREGSPRRFTRFFDERRAEIDALAARVEAHLSDRRLLDHFPGTWISSKDGVTTIRFDFEAAPQMENFRRDLGRGWAVREPYAAPQAVTPGTSSTRLHLLRGMDDALVRDRPLSLTSPVDPAKPITVEFALDTLASPFFLAIDVDGLQCGILSADPESPAWRERWRFPEGAFPAEKGESMPAHDHYGRGRGVLFHAGTDFGDPPAWGWPPTSHGRFHPDWAEEIRKRRELPGHLFAFEPDRRYEVKVVRDRGRITLFVDGKEVATDERTEWQTRGRASDIDRLVRGGTGRIQILSWTPVAIDDLTITGTILERWR